jgi:hypothetical protein
MLEAAPQEESGGNSRFTAGSIRVVYNGVADIRTLVPDLTPAEIEGTDFGTYTADQFFDESALSTRARISATTPTPNTAVWCWSSPASSPGRFSTGK